jgi:hypothetical protein
MRDTLEDIRNKLVDGRYKNEEHVRLSLVSRVLQKLCWNIWDPAEVNTEFASNPSEDKTRIDIALFINRNEPAAFIEIKPVGRLENGLADAERQLRDYNRNNTATFSILTDGDQWRFYYPQSGGEFSKKLFKVIKILEGNLEDAQLYFEAFLLKGEVQSGRAKQEAEKYLNLSQKQRAMEDSLPEARRMVEQSPYPSLPEALCGLVEKRGFDITRNEAGRFISESGTRPQDAQEKSSTRRDSSDDDDYEETERPIGISMLDSEYTNTVPSKFVLLGKQYPVSSWHEMLMKVSGIMYKEHSSEFQKACQQVKGRGNYFSTRADDLRKPEKISGSNYFVETNMSADQIVKTCEKLIGVFGYRAGQLKIEKRTR